MSQWQPGLNKLCEIEDYSHPNVYNAIREMEPEYVAYVPSYPTNREHRKGWEYGQLLRGARELGVLRPDAMALGVAAGHEKPIFWLTNHVRWVFATDIYGSGDFAIREATSNMLVNPDQFGGTQFNRRRLVVQYMNALDLRYEDNTFDFVFSLSSIEHFGGVDGARQSLAEIGRVLKPGGIACIATECVVNGEPDLDQPGLYLFSPATLNTLFASVPPLQLVEPIDFRISDATMATTFDLSTAVEEASRGHSRFPHIVLRHEGRIFTSVSVFLRKP